MTDLRSVYFRDLHPLLTAEDERRLAQAIELGQEAQRRRTGGCPQAGDDEVIEAGRAARDRFLRANVRLVVSMAKRRSIPGGMDVLDLVQEGFLGLERAVARFDWRKGFKFSTYAKWWIGQAMTLAIDTQASSIRLPRGQTEKLRSALDAVDGDPGSLSGEAAVLHRMRCPRSLDAPLRSDQMKGYRDLADLTPSSLPSPEQLALAASERERLWDAVATLDERRRAVVEQKFGEGLTLAQIGDNLGVTHQWVSQLLREGLTLLREEAHLDSPQVEIRHAERASLPHSRTAGHNGGGRHQQCDNAKESLIQHAEAVLRHLKRLDRRWAGEVVVASPHRVTLRTTWQKSPGPALVVADANTSPIAQAFVLHEGAVGPRQAQRDRQRFDESQKARSEKERERRERRNAKRREQRATDPEWRERENARLRQRREDPGVRERENARRRERLAADPAWRDRENARQRQRREDLEVRERENARRRERRAADPEMRERENAKRRERWANNPERRERVNAQKRAQYRKRQSRPAETQATDIAAEAA